MEIKTKFKVGDTIYIVRKQKTKINCIICDGTGSVLINNESFSCPKCNGTGEIDKEVYKAENNIYKINQIKITVNINNISIKYNVKADRIFNIPEENIFKTQEEAQKLVDKLNGFTIKFENGSEISPISTNSTNNTIRSSGYKIISVDLSKEGKEKQVKDVLESKVRYKKVIQDRMAVLKELINKSLDIGNKKNFEKYSKEYNKLIKKLLKDKILIEVDGIE